MNDKALNYLLDCLHWYKYDKVYDQYKEVINNLVKKYDYADVCSRLIDFAEKKDNITKNRFKEFYNFMNYGYEYDDKLTDSEYMDREREAIEDFLKGEKWLIEHFQLDPTKRSKEAQEFHERVLNSLPKEYRTYTETFLYKKSKEYNISISQICERKGLIKQWLVFEE